MPRRLWIAALAVWPGLSQIWIGQEVLGLILGLLFAACLNLAILTRWVWTDAFERIWMDAFPVLALLVWVAGLAHTIWWAWLCHPDRHRAEIDRLYRDAMEAYLQGRWHDARRRLERILSLDETDAEALMQLGTIHVRLQDADAARRAFRQCLEQEGGAKWRWEIEQEEAKLGSS